MNKTELISAVANTAGLSKKDTEKAVNSVFENIGNALSSGDKIQVIGFGTFEVRKRKAREGRNPATGDVISIPEVNVPVFKPGKALKEKVK